MNDHERNRPRFDGLIKKSKTSSSNSKMNDFKNKSDVELKKSKMTFKAVFFFSP